MAGIEPRRREERKGRKDIEEVAAVVVDSAIKVHRALGPGLLESAYQKCLDYELRQAGIGVMCEVSLPIRYGGIEIDGGYRLDMLVDHQIVIENKAVEQILPIHEAQLLTYLKLSGHKLGFLLNWHVPLMKHGIKRMVNNL
jgi:GxxExxY protein